MVIFVAYSVEHNRHLEFFCNHDKHSYRQSVPPGTHSRPAVCSECSPSSIQESIRKHFSENCSRPVRPNQNGAPFLPMSQGKNPLVLLLDNGNAVADSVSPLLSTKSQGARHCLLEDCLLYVEVSEVNDEMSKGSSQVEGLATRSRRFG